MALAGRAGQRMAARLPALVSRTTMLALVMALPHPPSDTPRVLAVDEFKFATRKGHKYGTVLVDCDTHAPTDLLADRESTTFATRLAEHPGIEIICRDQGGAFADGPRASAPDSVQVADLWHTWFILAEAVKRLVSQHNAYLGDPDPAPGSAPEVVTPPASHAGRLGARVQQQHTAVHDLLDRGLSIRAVVHHLELPAIASGAMPEPGTWRGSPPAAGRTSPAPWTPTSPASTSAGEGHTSGAKLHAELRQRGFTRFYSVVRDYLQRFRRAPAGTTPSPRPPRCAR